MSRNIFSISLLLRTCSRNALQYCSTQSYSSLPTPPHNILPISSCLITQVRGAGHSKWQNIKDIKTTKDSARAMLFSRISLQIKVALKGKIFI